MNRDVAAGLGLLAFAGLYFAGALRIQQSELSDEVGAAGMPVILAALLAVLAALLAARGWLAGRPARAGGPTATAEGAREAGEGGAPIRRALGLLGIAALYVPVALALGYVVGLAFLIAAIAYYEGTRPTWRLAAVAVGGAAFFWFVFVRLLGVAQPRGILF